MNEYETLKEFWNKGFKNLEISKIDETWIEDEKIIHIFNSFINKETTILDYGTGSGWALFEIALRKEFKEAIGIDTSVNATKINNEIAALSGFKNVSFLAGDQNLLKDYINKFDFIWSVNTFDVLPDEIIEDIYPRIVDSLKDGGTLFVGLNPDFTEDELINLLKMSKEGHYFYKDNVLRANKKSIEEWIEFFSKKLTLVEQFKFTLVPQEKSYPRVGLLFRK